MGSTSETLQDPRWKIDMLVSWIPLQKPVLLSDVQCTSSSRALWGENQQRVKSVLKSHPRVCFHASAEGSATREHFRLQFDTNLWTVRVRTATLHPKGYIMASLTMGRPGGETIKMPYDLASDILCCVYESKCFFFCKDDELLRSRLGKKSQMNWRPGTLAEFEIQAGDVEKLEELFERCCRRNNINSQQGAPL